MSQVSALQAKLQTLGGSSVSTSSPVPVTVTVRELKVRTSPSTSASRVLSAYRGERVSVIAEVTGQNVEGNSKWYKTKSGYYIWSGGSTAPLFVINVNTPVQTNTQATQTTQTQPAATVVVNTQQTIPSLVCTYPSAPTGYHYEGNDTSTNCGKSLVKDQTQIVTLSPAQRDAQRVADMQIIISALDKYKAQFGNYPTPSLNMQVNNAHDENYCGDLSAAGSNDFIKELVDKGILSKVPVDPLNPAIDPQEGFCNDFGYTYSYFVYPAGAWGGDVAKGKFYILAVRSMDFKLRNSPKPLLMLK